MPAFPKRFQVTAIIQAFGHVFLGFDSVNQGPKSEEAPDEKKFEPHEVQDPITNDENLDR